MNLTKSIAETLAEKLTKDKFAEISKQTTDLRNELYDYLYNTIPEPIKTLYKSSPNYFKESSHFKHFELNRSFFMDKYVPDTTLENMDKTVKLNFVKRFNALDNLELELKSLRDTLCRSILAARTYKNLTKLYPEAAALLPSTETTTTKLTLDYSNLHQQVVNFPEKKKVETKEEKVSKVKAANKKEVEISKNKK